MDELSYALNIDPIELRMRNYADTDPDSGKSYSSKFLSEAYKLGADWIGWEKRSPKPWFCYRKRLAGRLRHGCGACSALTAVTPP